MIYRRMSLMMLRGLFLLLILVLPSCTAERAAVHTGSVEWRLDEFEVAPPELTKTGNPGPVDTPYGKAIAFNGKDDAFFLETNPLQGLRSFTVEAIMCPDKDGPREQRFLHIGEVSGDRMLLETRMTDDGQWYLDTYLRSGSSQKALIDENLLHPAGKWYHVALVVDDGRMVNYINSKPELEAKIDFAPINSGKTSIGVRLNKVSWFKGVIYKIVITPKALKPEQFTTH